MVFEGYGNPKCKSFVGLATSLKPTEGWDIKSILVCSKNLVKHPATPNLFQDSKNNWYLQWVALDSQNNITQRYQVIINLKDPKRILTENKYLLQQSSPGKWDDRNFGSGNVITENSTYYMFFEGANSWRCDRGAPYNESLWGIGLAKISEASLEKRLWEKSVKNPILTPAGLNAGSCWIGYPEIVIIDNSYFLYYYDPLTYWTPNDHSRTTFRRKLVSCDSCNFTKVIGKIIIDKPKNPHPNSISIDTCTDKLVAAFKTATNRYTFMLELPPNQKYCIEFKNGSEVISIKNQVAGKYCKKDPSGCNQDEIREDLPDDTSFQIHIK
jgi:hypothetical protein